MTNYSYVIIDDTDYTHFSFWEQWKSKDSLNFLKLTRKWFPTQPIKDTEEIIIKVMSYNVLAD